MFWISHIGTHYPKKSRNIPDYGNIKDVCFNDPRSLFSGVGDFEVSGPFSGARVP
jgi:hypothetical protein